MRSPDSSTARLHRLKSHIAITRVDHWVKNVFALPGIVTALALQRSIPTWALAGRCAVALVALGLVSSSNYVINEICDAPFDRFHPVKRYRPVPSGAIILPLAYAQWILLGLAGLFLAWRISQAFLLTMIALWIMGSVYNITPIRTKDIPYVDVLTEAINNPIRLVAGWVLVSPTIPPGSLVLSYWMVGCYFMALKRFAEHKRLAEDGSLVRYRKSLAFFTPELLLLSVVFYASAAMLFFGAFLMRYRMELVLSFPMISLVMAIYFSIAFKPDSAAEHPEKLYREPKLMLAVGSCALVMMLCLIIDMPWLVNAFAPTAPVAPYSGRPQ